MSLELRVNLSAEWFLVQLRDQIVLLAGKSSIQSPEMFRKQISVQGKKSCLLMMEGEQNSGEFHGLVDVHQESRAYGARW